MCKSKFETWLETKIALVRSKIPLGNKSVIYMIVLTVLETVMEAYQEFKSNSNGKS